MKSEGNNIKVDSGAVESLDLARKEELEKEVGDIAELFNAYGKPWFLVGGTSLELSEGEITRDHQDIDVALYYEDIGGLFDYCMNLGYRFFNNKGEAILSKEQLLAQKDILLLKKVSESKLTPRSLEIIFLKSNDEGNILFDEKNKLAFPKEIYLAARKYVAKNGQEVPLEPKEIVLMHKLLNGRMKDFNDIKKFVPTLTDGARIRLKESLKEIGITFVIGERKTQDLDELLQVAETTIANRSISDNSNKRFGLWQVVSSS